jgi:hypothetical protein
MGPSALFGLMANRQGGHNNPPEEPRMVANAASRPDEESIPADDLSTAETLDRALDHWRERIDELKVQVDLAALDVREDLAKRLEVTENVFLAVRSRLSDARHDTGASAASLRRSVDQLLLDLRRAYDDAEAVVRRGRKAKP